MHNRHAWNETTADGAKRYIEARKFGGHWSLRSKLGRSGEWRRHEPPLVGDLETLRGILANKYQRRRASHDDIRSVERLLAQARK